MDYSTINRNKTTDEIQNQVSDGLQDPKQNISNNPVISRDTPEPQRDAYDFNKFAKNEGHFYQHPPPPPPNIYPLPYEQLQQHNIPRDPKAQVIDLTTTTPTYLEAANLTKPYNENLNIPCKNPRNTTATEVAVPIDDDISILIPDESVVQNLKLEKQKNLEEYSNMPTTSTVADQLQADTYNVKPDTNTQNPKISDTVDDEETIEKIAEMIASSSNDSNENSSPKTKKQLQILMSRSHTDPNDNNSSLENSLTIEHDEVEIKTRQNQVNVIATNEIYKEKSTEIANETSLINNTKLVSESGTPSPSIKSVPETKPPTETIKTPDKIRFEEVENKLEEMFAGIEDEQLLQPTHTKADTPIINTDKIENDFVLETIKSSEILENVKTGDNSRDSYKSETILPKSSSLPTKAAKKSTDSFIPNTNRNKPSPAPPEDKTEIEAKKYLKSMPPRRRLSVGIDPSLLRISFESPPEIKQKPKDIADKNVTSENSNGKKSNHLSKSAKMKANRNKNGANDKKREDNFKSSNNKKQVKTETNKTATKQKQQQKLKQTLAPDNDNDQQTRDLENKIRSPFILVKHNGTITVVNATSSDDYNEKNTKAKKTGTYVHERKNVRGCHSSTLSNRYDADTADSTWICVFCKCGPHKKGLGDLFGPYIISVDCEDYCSAVEVYNSADATSLLNKRRRTDLISPADSSASPGKSSWKSKSPNEAAIPAHLNDSRNIAGDADDTSYNMFSLGMSKISDSSFEIWIHEDCAIWAPNLFVIGSRLVGLEAAIWNSTRHKCVLCLKPGAMICCLQRDCKITAHVPCARESNWSLDESTFWSHCSKHVSKAFRKD